MGNGIVKFGTTLTVEQRRILDELCKEDRRTISATLGLLIEQEWQRRHSSPVSAPVPAGPVSSENGSSSGVV